MIVSEVLTALLRECRDDPEVEICGLLWGSSRDQVEGYVPYPGPLFAGRFQLTEEWLLEQCLRLRYRGRLMLGYYHSHPGNSLELSRRDLEGHPPGSLVLVLNPAGKWKLSRT